MTEGITTYKPEVKASKSDKRLRSFAFCMAIQSCAFFQTHFFLLMNGAANYLILCRCLLAKILTSLHLNVIYCRVPPTQGLQVTVA